MAVLRDSNVIRPASGKSSGRVLADRPMVPDVKVVRAGQAEPFQNIDRRVPTTYKRRLPRYRLKRVLDYVRDNLAEDLSLSQLAEVADMSPHYFSELFKQSTGLTVHRYVLLRRIEFAKKRLSDPRRRIIDIGLDAGFQNPSHFARVFRKLVGTSPRVFRSGALH